MTASPRSDANAQTALPAATPSAVSDAARGPERSAFRTTSAVSGPGVTMSSVETAKYASSRASINRRRSRSSS